MKAANNHLYVHAARAGFIRTYQNEFLVIHPELRSIGEVPEGPSRDHRTFDGVRSPISGKRLVFHCQTRLLGHHLFRGHREPLSRRARRGQKSGHLGRLDTAYFEH